MKVDSKTQTKHISHIGIAVESIDAVLSFYTDSLGLELESIEKIETENVKVAFIRIGKSCLELLEPLNDSSVIRRFLDRKGEGIHHIALESSDIHSRLQQLKQQGIPLINEAAKTGARNSQIAFIHPKAANGVLFELCQHEGSDD